MGAGSIRCKGVCRLIMTICLTHASDSSGHTSDLAVYYQPVEILKRGMKMGDVLLSGDELRKRGYKPTWEEYPPFRKTVSIYFADQIVFRIGTIVISGDDNNVCLRCEDKYYNLDNYITYWKVIS